ncbi:MAG TPA: cysteine--tRNA ligase [Candidatus Moranbacteria bacterium]|nr:cysteine--tRNA ligase [Candidatus Moranbacteria bacterium]
MLKLYNTLSKAKEKFKPINVGKVSIYSCGPTVYDFVHLGNIKSYMTADVLRRYLEYSGYETRMIKNITDVGHLTEDDINQGDSGEDKIAKKARLEKKTPSEIANFYEKYFYEIEERMNILPAHYFPHATAHIPQMIKMITELIKKDFAYEVNGNVFFDVTKFSDYGKLSGNTLDNLKVGARLEEHPDKKNPWDFALWIKAPKEHLLKWESPWSLGYPGWHIECSAMSSEYLGDTFDIHTGGEDNIFPHHEAEIAQSEGYSGKKFVNFWVHTRHLLVDGQKMAKSKGNFYRLEDIVEKGYSPSVLRLLILSAHYRTQLNFTWKSMEQAKTNLEKITDFLSNLENITSEKKGKKINLEKYRKKIEKAMDDDLNTPLAISVFYELMTEANKLIAKEQLNEEEAEKIIGFWEKINKFFGLVIPKDLEQVPLEVKQWAEERKEARMVRNFAYSDELRKKIEAKGYLVEDVKNNKYTLKKKK